MPAPPPADGLALVAALRDTHTPPHLLGRAVEFLKANPFADAEAAYAVLAADPDLPEGTLRKARALLDTGRPPEAAVSADPLDEVRVLRGEKPAAPLADPGAADRAAAKVAAAERDAERARAEALQARLDAAEARAAADRARVAEMEALFEQATSPSPDPAATAPSA